MSASSRRRFMICLLSGLGAMALWPGRIWAAAKRRLLPPGTKMSSLINQDPAGLDPSQLATTPVEEFGTMGATQAGHSRDAWRLSITGLVREPVELNYQQVTALPKLQKPALLVCPGFFAYYAEWAGISLAALLERAGVDPKARWAEIAGGPPGDLAKVEQFEIKGVLADQVFLAYAVNGKELPEKHGFPLRAVVIDEYGSHWVKYVQRIRVAG